MKATVILFFYAKLCHVLLHIHTKYEGIKIQDKKVQLWTDILLKEEAEEEEEDTQLTYFSPFKKFLFLVMTAILDG